jgi:uncharacterized membrane protein YcgQ (UPF0703/DUF1980 family)
MCEPNYRNYLTWEGFLKEYTQKNLTKEEERKEEDEFTQKFGAVYNYGKIKLLLVILNKITLFVGLCMLVLFFTRFIYLTRLFLHTCILFFFLDIFIDETIICIPFCDFINSINNSSDSESGSSYLNLNVSLSIELSDKKDEKEVKEKKVKEKDYEVINNDEFEDGDFDDEYDD